MGESKFLTRKSLFYYTRGELEHFKMCLKFGIARAQDAAEGNRFCQDMQDGGIFSEKRKGLANRIQFIDVKWE